MKRLLLIIAVFTASCSTLHKIKTDVKTSVDSVSRTMTDTVSVKTDVTKQQNIQAKDIDITINYDKDTTKGSDTVKWTPYYPTVKQKTQHDQSIQEILEDAISSGGNAGRIPSSISIHIGSIGDSSVTIVSVGSTSGKTVSIADVKKKTDNFSKTVTRTGLSVWVYVGLGLLVIAGIIWLVIKLKIL